MRFTKLIFTLPAFFMLACTSHKVAEYRNSHQIQLAKLIEKYSHIYDQYEYREAREKVSVQALTDIDNFARSKNYRFEDLKGIVVAVKPFYGYYKFQVRYHVFLEDPANGKPEYSSIIYSHTYSENDRDFALTKGLEKGDTIVFSGRYLRFDNGKVAVNSYENVQDYTYINPEFSVDFTQIKKQ